MKKILLILTLILSYNSYSQMDGVKPSNIYFINGENIAGDNNFIQVPDDAYWYIAYRTHSSNFTAGGGIFELAYFDTATENYVYPPVTQNTHSIVHTTLLPEKTRIWIDPNNAYDCPPDAVMVIITEYYKDSDSSMSVNETQLQDKIRLFPNPTTSEVVLNSDKQYDIEVYDILGNKVMELTGNTIDMEHLSSATYIVNALDTETNERLSYKVIKN